MGRRRSTAALSNICAKCRVRPILGVPWSRQRSIRLPRSGPPCRAWFEATFEAPTPAQSEGWAAIAARPPHADPCPDRQRQDPRRVPVVPGPPRRAPPAGTHEGAARHRPRAVRQPAEGADVRRRAQPPGSARRHRPRGRPPRRRTAEHPRRIEDRRHARPTSAATSSGTRRTSSSPRPRASTSCSRARRARSCGASST